MKRKTKVLILAIAAVASFIILTLLVLVFDVKEVGQCGTNVGLASFNVFVHKAIGVHMTLYTVTDYLGLIPILFVMGFALLGLYQLIKRRSFLKVDRDILLLGAFYALIAAVFLFFEIFVVNYRPILIDGRLEASYPSSTTLLTMCVMPTAAIYIGKRIKSGILRVSVSIAIWIFTAFTVSARLISGVHWAGDIIGGALISTGLVLLYVYFSCKK